MKSFRLLALLALAMGALLLSCSKDDSNPTTPAPTPGLTLTAPNGGGSCVLGMTQAITWTSTDLTAEIRIDLNRAYPSATWETLIASTANNGSYTWTVGGAVTTTARLRVVAVGQTTVGDTSDANFTIAAPAYTPTGMARIAAGGQSFQMGSEHGAADELPLHAVSFTHDFWMDSTEVTQADYDALMTASYSGYQTPSWHPPYGVGAAYPAYSVYWGDAALYCNARSRRDGLDSVYTYTAINGMPGNLCELEGVVIDYTKAGYRLPTEAEWEYAARGGVSDDFYWGASYDPYPSTASDSLEVNRHAVWFANAWIYGADSAAFGTHAVGTKEDNPYHLFDMAGNVFEWCNDWYGDYAAGAVSNPTGPATGDWRCLRGGSWGSHATALRSANRTFSVPDYLYYFIGFRAVLPVQ